MVDLLDERNDVAAGIATETMKQVSRRRHMERRRFLVMKWAEPFQTSAAGALELQVLAYDLVDAAALAHEGDVGGADATLSGHQLLPPITAAPAAAPMVAWLRRLSTTSSHS